MIKGECESTIDHQSKQRSLLLKSNYTLSPLLFFKHRAVSLTTFALTLQGRRRSERREDGEARSTAWKCSFSSHNHKIWPLRCITS